MSDADLLRQAAGLMRDFGPIHEAIAEGLVKQADRADATGEPIEPEALDLAHAYVDEVKP